MDISSEVGTTRYESNKAAESLVPMMLSPSVCTMWILRKDSARSSERLGRVSGRTRQGLRKDSARSSEGLGTVFGRTRQGLRKDSARSSEGFGTVFGRTRHGLRKDSARSSEGLGTVFGRTRHGSCFDTQYHRQQYGFSALLFSAKSQIHCSALVSCLERTILPVLKIIMLSEIQTPG